MGKLCFVNYFELAAKSVVRDVSPDKEGNRRSSQLLRKPLPPSKSEDRKAVSAIVTELGAHKRSVQVSIRPFAVSRIPGDLHMSMELFVLFAMQDAPNLDEWKSALTERDLPVSITEEFDLSKDSGFLPMRLENKDTGLYFLIEDYADLAAHIPPLKEISIEEPVVYSLGYGGHFDEAAVVFYSAYTMTTEFSGLAFEPQGRVFMNADALLEAAKLSHDMVANQ